MSHRSCSSFLLFGLLVPPLALGLQDDREQPIQLEADRAQYDRNTGISVYEGEVAITQGTMRLTADKVTVYTNDNVFQRLEALGNPATFEYQPTPEKEVINGEGQQLRYDATTTQVTITNNAKITQSGDVFTGKRIEYDLANDIVKASSGEDSSDRVQITIQPKAAEAIDTNGS